MENKEKIEEAKVRALGLFTKDKFACSEAILYTVNAILGNPLPSEIVKLASGFTGGIGRSGSVCGALTGGVMALGLAFGRTNPGAPAQSFSRQQENSLTGSSRHTEAAAALC